MDAVRFEGALAFLHTSALFRTGNDLQTLVEAGRAAGLEPVTLHAYDLNNLEQLCQAPSNRTVVIVHELHELLAREDAGDLLGRARPLVSNLRDRGARVILMSNVPVSRFPGSLGSPLLLDAQVAYPRLVADEEIRESLTIFDLDERDIENIVKFSSGSPALAYEYARISKDGGSGNEKLHRVQLAESTVALACMDELGPEICAELEFYAYECRIETCGEGEIPGPLLQVLRQAGLAKISTPSTRVELLPFANRATWLESPNRALQMVVSPPAGWHGVAEGLFAIERVVRLALYEFALEHLGSRWLESLSDYSASITGLASQDTALEIQSLSDVRQPLDWLTFESLLEYGQQCTANGLTTSIAASDWNRLRVEALPIRNRLAHMRLPRQSDQAVVRRWRNSLELRWASVLLR
jgi:hypothetical protein